MFRLRSSFALLALLATLPALAFPALTGGCGSAQPPNAVIERQAGPPPPPAAGAIGAANAANQLGMHIYLDAAKASPGNVALSPLSIAAAMTMTQAGAGGETAAEMYRALLLSAISGSADDPAAIDRAVIALSQRIDLLGEAEGITVSMANRLFGQRGEGFEPSFVERLNATYGAGFVDLDFKADPEAARLHINGWVSERTEAMIPELLPTDVVNRQTRLALVNAIYFKGSWQSKFDPQATTRAPFYTPGGDPLEVDLMYQAGTFSTRALPGARVLELPYVGGGLSMLVVLPEAREGLPALEASLSAGSATSLAEGLASAEVKVWLPRFRVEGSGLDLITMFTALGMPSAFDPERADFSPMNGKRDLFIGAIVHKAIVEVSEEGTEAAAATAVLMETDSASAEPEVIAFRADHPFLYFIRDRETGVVLFMGRVVKPM